jgi:hypothetical protein
MHGFPKQIRGSIEMRASNSFFPIAISMRLPKQCPAKDSTMPLAGESRGEWRDGRTCRIRAVEEGRSAVQLSSADAAGAASTFTFPTPAVTNDVAFTDRPARNPA